ncbi:type VII secretion target [Hoyosella subflava]|uniref:ESX-1 secretion-associated protein n=1 Tax=Hoyosella subflava (strain DSM 45089 / JCM 17490 / NBRC 109087 / DQS3-9A1) TaxID=443218 RepID=F6EGR4_HOYSD|nr:type VII secretion target [Hoyosella subflava]AEF42302.1 hypothetical protein AS9A_3864 [Hoyosella subflava DQS3-9A1]
MSELVAAPEEIRRFGVCAEEQRTRLTLASASVAALEPAHLAPALGLIGSDYLAAFNTARQRYVSALTSLAHVAGGMSSTAAVTAQAYTTRDAAFSAALGGRVQEAGQ